MQDLLLWVGLFAFLTCPASPLAGGRVPSWAWIAWSVVTVALIAAVAAWAVLHDGEGRGRLAAIDACTHKGGKAVVQAGVDGADAVTQRRGHEQHIAHGGHAGAGEADRNTQSDKVVEVVDGGVCGYDQLEVVLVEAGHRKRRGRSWP